MTVRESGRDAVMTNCNPRDGLDRLRHLRPPLLRAPDGSGRARGDRGRAPGGRDRPVRRPDAAAARQGAAGGGGSSCSGRWSMHRPRRGPGAVRRPAAPARGRAPAVRHRAPAEEAAVIAEDVKFPLVWPSYVLGGRAMEIRYSPEQLDAHLRRHVKADQEHLLLLDRFLEDAIEVDVDALADGTTARSRRSCSTSRRRVFTRRLGVRDSADEPRRGDARDPRDDPPPGARARRRGLDQHPVRGRGRAAVRDRGEPARLAHGAVRLEGDRSAPGEAGLPADALGEPLDIELPTMHNGHVSVKEAVLPFARLFCRRRLRCSGLEMKSTGEVMGIAGDFLTAFGKAQAAAGVTLPTEGTVFITGLTATRPLRPSSRRAFTISASRSSPPRALHRRSRGWASRCARSTRSSRARPTWSTSSATARSIS